MILAAPGRALAQDIEGDAANGKSIFNSQCAACHKLDKKVVGPALGDVTQRRSTEWLVSWIKDNAALRASGDADANAIFEEFNGLAMPAFPQLSDQDIKDVLAYTIEGNKPAEVVPGTETAPVEAEADNTVYLYILGVLLLFMVVLLARVKNTLKLV